MKKLFLTINICFFLLISVFPETISFAADSMMGQAGSKTSSTKLIGDAYVKTDTMEIEADSIELSGEDYRTIVAQGHIKGKNLETNMEFTCNSLSYDRMTKLAVLQGNVSLTDIENDVKAEAQIIEYNQDTEVAVLQIQVKLLQKNNVCTGAYALYNKKAQTLEISGNAQVKQDEDTFRAQQISLNLETQDITLSGNVKGSVKDDGTKKEAKKEEEENAQ